MATEHGHSHSHDQGHHAGARSQAFAVGIALNFGFVVVEVVYGLVSQSMALVADAGHNLGDIAGLALAWGAALLAKRKPTKRRTYGFRSSTIVAALANGLILLFVTGGIAWESIRRLFTPETVAAETVIVVALVGVVINAGSAALFMSGRKDDVNIRSAFLHLASDAGLALGVAAAGAVVLFTGWHWLDPLVSIVLSLFILVSTWSLLRDSMNLVLDAVPEGIEPDDVKTYLTSLPGVIEVHDLHIWAMSTTENALTAHLVMPSDACHAAFVGDVVKELHDRFGVEHSTLQVEPPNAPTPCVLAPDETV